LRSYYHTDRWTIVETARTTVAATNGCAHTRHLSDAGASWSCGSRGGGGEVVLATPERKEELECLKREAGMGVYEELTGDEQSKRAARALCGAAPTFGCMSVGVCIMSKLAVSCHVVPAGRGSAPAYLSADGGTLRGRGVWVHVSGRTTNTRYTSRRALHGPPHHDVAPYGAQ
jgi:hypothetical protein